MKDRFYQEWNKKGRKERDAVARQHPVLCLESLKKDDSSV